MSKDSLLKLAPALAAAKASGVKIDISKFDKYSEFRKKYRHDFSGFMRDCVNWKVGGGPAEYQIEIADKLVEHRRECARGPHGLGKTCLIALAVHWFALTRDIDNDWKIPITASAWRQLTKYAWPEIKKWSRRLKWEIIGRDPYNERTELLTLSLKLDSGEAFAMASDNSALIEGAHADFMLYIFDESKEIPIETWDSAEGAFSTGDCMWLAVSTPGEPVGRFYDIQARKPGYEDWHTTHITKERAIEAGRMLADWAAARKRQWTEESAVYQNRVEGNFAASEEDSTIPLKWVELANKRYLDWVDAGKVYPTFTCVGADIARSGEDHTSLALRFDWLISEIRKSSKEDLMATVGRIVAVLRHWGGYAIVDVIGIGAGVVDRLKELPEDSKKKYEVKSFNASERTDQLDSFNEFGFVNVRSAAWWNAREMLDPESGNNIALPPDDELLGDLTAPRYKVVSGGKYQIESKDDIKKRIGRSTDDGDAVVMALFGGIAPSVNDWINALKKHTESESSWE